MCGHTGSVNRGCEAIVRSTKLLLQQDDVESIAMSFNITGDQNVGLDKDIEIIPYPKKNALIRLISFIKSKLFSDYIWGSSFYHNDIIRSGKDFSVIFNVGGDTYCYGIPWISISMNLLAKKHGYPTVFWGCSVDESIEQTKVLQSDINNYDFIVARESYSYAILKRNYNGTHLRLACDPAFHLKPMETSLPIGFIEYNTVGINISPVMVDIYDMENSIVFKSTIKLIDHICETSDFNICLIPHVYQINPPGSDYLILNHIFKRYRNNGRVTIVDSELNAGQLKYLISKCKFFIGARTHSVIAAYSSEVPALALSYSIKSRGLAYDVMGSEKGYAIPWKEIKNDDQLVVYYEQYLVKEEASIRKRLHNLMPEYKKTLLNVIKEMKTYYHEE